MPQVDHYGIHWAPGRIAFLHQGEGARNAIGLGEPSPFILRGRLPACPHSILLDTPTPREHLSSFRSILASVDAARFLLPVPPPLGANVAYLPTINTRATLITLAQFLRMSAPTRAPVQWWWGSGSRSDAQAAAHLTNVQPLVLAGLELDHIDSLLRFSAAALFEPRAVLALTHMEMPAPSGVRVISFKPLADLHLLDVSVLPWEAFGATVVRAVMRRNWDTTRHWFVDEGVLDA